MLRAATVVRAELSRETTRHGTIFGRSGDRTAAAITSALRPSRRSAPGRVLDGCRLSPAPDRP